MRRGGRGAAVGATALALVFAAAGTSLVAVRAARYEDGVAGSGVAQPAPAAMGRPSPNADRMVDQPPVPESVPRQASAAGSSDAVGPAAPGPAGSERGAAPGGQTFGGSATSGRSPASASSVSTRGTTAPTLGPASGPTPTTPPRPVVTCPSDEGTGALPARSGPVQAVDYSLPWPATGSLVLLPLSGAAQVPGAPLKLLWSTFGVLGLDGSSLTLSAPVSTMYTVVAGDASDHGLVTFGPVGLTVNLDVEACAGQSFVLYDVARGASGGSPIRIVGVVADQGLVSIDGRGGMARFRAGRGTYRVTLVTANDAGTAGPLVNATVTVG